MQFPHWFSLSFRVAGDNENTNHIKTAYFESSRPRRCRHHHKTAIILLLSFFDDRVKTAFWAHIYTGKMGNKQKEWKEGEKRADIHYRFFTIIIWRSSDDGVVRAELRERKAHRLEFFLFFWW